ncbi:MAG TPA: Do family serine endopeptidase [Candidatus Omnitrophota bacterium]|nr:Do family serine endopeptidase [Candidatus Omnitrophota bacterium]HPD85303.1 Do family serine endopeptidase [Candidatus Omnitrophota bacterium]HRZ04196.1 Do family serine endopeptidase [Candidatus Omnitrophota bacterium]
MNRQTKKSFLSVLVIFTVLGAGISFDCKNFTSATMLYAQTAAVATTDNFTHAVENVAAGVGPAVVSILTEKVERHQMRRSFRGSPFEDEFLDRFFEDFFGEIPDREFKRSGMGSGVIIDKRGYILTNQHVIEDTDTITVTLPDGREFKATLKGTDPRSDLAVVKIDAPDLPIAKLGDSDTLKIGQWVVAIGSPFGNLLSNPEPTVTAGVISALHRSLPRTSRRDLDYTDLVQTDAAINPGNSGGPLVNLDGEIIGINVAIFSTSGGYQGIGFAIPVNTAKRIVTNLIEGKEVDYGWIGVSIQDVDEQLAQYFGLSKSEGAVVSKVLDDGPAQKAGIKDGDVILSADGKPIKDVNALLKIIGNTPVGKKIAVEVVRDKKTITLSITVGKRPSFDEEGEMITKEEASRGPVETKTNQWRGLTVENITRELSQRLNIKSTNGVVVVAVEDNSPAQKAELNKGDVITMINKELVRDTRDFQVAIQRAKGDCLIQTMRGFVVIKEQ